MVVDNDHLEDASKAIAQAGFPECRDFTCFERQHDRRRQVAEIHFHIKSKYPEHTVLSIYTKSSIVWWLPAIPVGSPAEDDPNLMLSNDPRLPPYNRHGCTGPLRELYPMKILNPSAFTEAIIWLICRDLWHPDELDLGWMQHLTYLVEKKPAPALSVTKSLRGEFKSFWETFGRNGMRPSVEEPNPRAVLYEFADTLLKNRGLPIPPPFDASRINEGVNEVQPF